VDEKNRIRVVELFAGVGGFRLGLDGTNNGGVFEVVWSNQWEPATKRQCASEVYVARFGKEWHSNCDITTVQANTIPDHDLLVGGFPCQDYSVARNLSQAKGLHGKKGVLWWDIHRILKEKAPDYLLLENVDRLLRSPVSQRGHDFATILRSLSELGYFVEWRVINAADHGMPQRRKRIYMMAYKRGSVIYQEAIKDDPKKWLVVTGLIAQAFPVTSICDAHSFYLNNDHGFTIDDNKSNLSPFENTGMMYDGNVHTIKTSPKDFGKKMTLGDLLVPEEIVPKEFYIDTKDLPRWEYLKGAKREKRKTRNGFTYNYTEGAMIFPDRLDRPSRTIITGEGGSSPSRFKHVIQVKDGRYRRLTPTELERLFMFPDGHTSGVPDVKRAFLMGNAVVVGVIKNLGDILAKYLLQEELRRS
jgi:DNA (cytosine-5)-methyltransferase 1